MSVCLSCVCVALVMGVRQGAHAVSSVFDAGGIGEVRVRVEEAKRRESKKGEDRKKKVLETGRARAVASLRLWCLQRVPGTGRCVGDGRVGLVAREKRVAAL